MNQSECKAVVDGFVAEMEARAPDQNFRSAFALGALQERAFTWLCELEQLKSNKLQEEMEQLRRRLGGKKMDE